MAAGTKQDFATRLRDAIQLRQSVAVAVATVAVLVSYGALLTALSQPSGGGASRVAGSAFGVGLALIPMAYGLAAVTTGQRRVLATILKSVGLWLLASPLLVVDVILGLTASYSLGLTTALHDRHAVWLHRVLAVAAVMAIAVVLRVVIPPAAVFGPLVVVGPAILFADNRARQRTDVDE